MSDQVDEFAEALRLRLTRVEALLQGLKSELQESADAQGAALQSKLDAARANAQEAARDMRTAQSKAKNWVQAREAAGAAVIQGWKDGHEDRKLAQHAQRAEDNAVAGLYFAEAAIANAVLSSYEALDARLAAGQRQAA